MAWLFSFVLMAIQKGQDSPPPGRQLQAVPPPHLALLPLHRRHLAHHLRQLEQHWLLLPLCHPQLPLARAQAGGPQLHRHLPRAAAGEFGHQVDILSKRQDHPQLACWISDFLFWFFALYAIIVYHKLLWYFIFILFLIITKVLSRARRPWDRQALGAVRKSADNVLCTGKVPIQHEDHHIF